MHPYHLVIHALAQRPFLLATLPELLVAGFQALPVLAELGQAVSVDILETGSEELASPLCT